MDERLDQAETEEAPHGYAANSEFGLRPRSNFDQKLLAFLALRPRSGRDGMRDGRRAAMLQVFDGRASWAQVRHWRRGTVPAPQWALEMLNAKISERLKELHHGLAA